MSQKKSSQNYIDPANIGTRIILEYSNHISVIILFKKYNRSYRMINLNNLFIKFMIEL